MNVNKILFATDFSEFSDAAARYAVSIARDTGATLYVVHVIEPPSYGPYPGGLVDRNESLLKQMLDEMISDYANIAYESHVLVGDPATEIVRYAGEQQFDLVVISTHGRSGFTRMLMGSVAESVVRRAPCPVMTIKHKEQVTAGEPS